MAVITPAEALLIVPLATMKDELRIEQTETSHDALLTGQIVSGGFLRVEDNGRHRRRPTPPSVGCGFICARAIRRLPGASTG